MTITAAAVHTSSETPAHFEFLMRVTRVRQAHPQFTVVSALVVQEDGCPVPRAPNYSVVIPAHVTVVAVCQGQRWRITGNPERVDFETRDGWQVQEMRFTARSATLERTSGAHIVALLCGEQFPGVGPVTAQRAWDILGESLYDVLDSADHDKLGKAVGRKCAETLIAGWTCYSSTELLRWMHAIDLDVRVGRKVLRVYGREAFSKMQADPYRLLALGLSWRATDAIATTYMGIAADDSRRLAAAVEAELYSIFDAGDTFALRAALTRSLARTVTQTLADTAVDVAIANGVVLANGSRVYAPGPYLLERTVCEAIAARTGASKPMFDALALESHIDAFESLERQRSGNPLFALNAAQRQAARMGTTHEFFCLIGGAGVGKTTSLDAIGYLLDLAGRPIFLLAPTGKAAKRMRQATRRPAMTIAGFLRNVVPKGIPPNSVVVIDESSMLDIQLAYQLVTSVPAQVRLILIGDPAQLPPVGPGLTLHAITQVAAVPSVELIEGKRFSGRIAHVAAQVRQGVWQEDSAGPSQEFCFMPCEDSALPARVVEMYLLDPTNSQVLCCTKTTGAAPTKLVNQLCQEALRGTARRLLVHSNERQRLEDTGLREGDPVICTKNLWDHDLQNGSIGRLSQLEDPPLPYVNDAGECVGNIHGWVDWDDGERRPVTDDVLDVLELAYAITVHKSQGSEVPIVVIPIYRARNLDRTMLYTALTRATRKVILLGDRDEARAAVEAEPSASRRRIMLGELLNAATTPHV